MKKLFKYLLSILFLILLITTGLGHLGIGDKFALSTEMIEIKDEKIRILEKGDGQPILFIHGTPGSIEDWLPLMDSLSDDFRTIAFDRPGHGYSTANNYNRTLEENVDIVLELIKKLKLEKPLIVGHSYGGSISAHLAANHLIDSARYVIIDAPLYKANIDIIYHPIALPVIGEGIAWLAANTIAPTFIKNGLSKTTASISENELDKMVSIRKEIWTQPKVILSRARELINLKVSLERMIPKYNLITAPTTILTGRSKHRTLVADCERFHKVVPNSELRIYENCAHYVQFDKFKEVLSEIRNNLNAHNF